MHYINQKWHLDNISISTKYYSEKKNNLSVWFIRQHIIFFYGHDLFCYVSLFLLPEF